MMILLMLLLAAQASAPVPSPEIKAPVGPEFTFREHRSNANYDMSAPALKDCDPSPGGVECTGSTEVAGNWAAFSYQLANRKLARLTIIGERYSYPASAQAFEAKYGQPCEQRTVTKKNGYGADFSSLETVWCFRTGKFTLEERGFRTDTYRATYVDNFNRPATPQPNVDF